MRGAARAIAVLVICGVLDVGSARADPAGGKSSVPFASDPREFRVPDTSEVVHVVEAQRIGDEVSITLRVDRGYHINANPASLEYLIPTTIAFAGAVPSRITYPAPVLFRPKFADSPLAVYEGTVTMTALFPANTVDNSASVSATVTAQACTDRICLPPAELTVNLGGAE